MIGTSTSDYVLIRTSIALLRAITPLSILYVALIPFIPRHRLPRALEAWPIAETAFYLLVYLPRKRVLQRPARHPPRLERNERRELLQRCLEEVHDPDQYLSKWFLDAPLSEIKRENIKEFFRWVLLNTEVADPDDDGELEGYVRQLEEAFGRKLEDGRGSAKCLRLTLDRVKMVHRSLLWYLIVFVVDSTTHISMLYYKFQYHRTPITRFPLVFPFRPLTLFTTRHSPVRSLSYWHRPHTSRTKLPVLFIHGIGIGLWPYVNFLAALGGGADDEDDGDIGVIALEILPVSFRIAGAALSREDMCRQIQTILLRHGFEKFVLVAHSYGSVITTHLLKNPEVASQISSIVLVDPVSILLHLPDVAYNFTYRTPKHANEWQLWYFASRDMSVAQTLFRRFFWAENILWKEDILGQRVTVFLGGRDLIVDTQKVGSYLTRLPGSGDEETTWNAHPEGWKGEDGLSVVWCEELDHAQIFDSRKWMPRLVREIHSLSGR
ncbi:MAG: hypothetical protein M1840_005112 [Geoglossum simile]|nr:MAG: hypothetical protein M1840_005112 [Geoglossum simile]